MVGKFQSNFLTVAPFECVWDEELRFSEAGRGCIAFEAFAHNDVTLVFREQAGSQHYHYKMDSCPNYTVVLGSHRNRRLKIEVDGRPVVDIAGIGLCSSSAFQSYWIGIYDGVISIGKGRKPFQNLVFQWSDSKPNRRVQYVGLSSWDKHVGYRNVSILPMARHPGLLGLSLKGRREADWEGGEDEWGLQKFVESWELSDVFFVVGDEGKVVPAHRVILSASSSGGFDLCPGECFIRLPWLPYTVLRAFLDYIYVGRAQIRESDLASLLDLCLKFRVAALAKQCQGAIDRLSAQMERSDTERTVELTNLGERIRRGVFSYEPSLDFQTLRSFLSNGELSDVQVFVDGHDHHQPVAVCHKIVLSMWSIPFFKMFTNGMLESKASKITLSDVSVDALLACLRFMYGGKLEPEDESRVGTLLVPLLLLADQFGIKSLHQECCDYCLQRLSEDSVCSILQAIAAIPSCGGLKAECVRKFSKHFDYCTTSNGDFSTLEEDIFVNILEHPELTVTTEERILDAIFMWCMNAEGVYGWETIDEQLKLSGPDQLFSNRLSTVNSMLRFVRFPLLPTKTLNKLERSFLARLFPELDLLLKEALQFKELGVRPAGCDQCARFQHRRSSFKELTYICDGDNNGVLYYAGTSYGEHPWVNPVLAKRVTLTASSPVSRYTDPKALVSRTYQGTSYAGPRIEDGRPSAWWIIDIGLEHQLMCNYYTLRQDGSSAFLRNWALQGSLDTKTWIDLRVHENDLSICKPGQFSSWPVIGPSALLPFRFFRIITTGPSADVSNSLNLCICFVELYGYFC